MYVLFLNADFPFPFFNERGDSLPVRLVDEIGMRLFGLFCVLHQSNDALPFEIREPFVIARGERTANASIAIAKRVDTLEGQMKARYTFDDVFTCTRVVFGKHIAKQSLNVFRICTDMSSNTHPLIALSEPAGNIFANVGNKHLMKKKHTWERNFRLFCFCFDIPNNAREIFRFKDFAFAHKTVKVNLEENFFRFFKSKRAIFNSIRIVDLLGNFCLGNHLYQRLLAWERAVIPIAKRLNYGKCLWYASHIAYDRIIPSFSRLCQQ